MSAGDLVMPASGQDLTAKEVLVGLIDYGLFSEKVPPCFTTVGLFSKLSDKILSILDESDEATLKEALKKSSHDYIRYEALRDINIPRQMGIPHPESYSVQALAISKHWTDLQKHFAKPSPRITQVFVRRIDGQRIFEMNYKGTDRFELEEAEIQYRSGAQFLVRTDISACFPSIYTHSIPWALVGRKKGKSDREITSPGNMLDRCTQITRDSQTNGILIGPHASNVISEIILASVDDVMIKKGFSSMTRHIDDYRFYAKSHEEAEQFLQGLGLALRECELVLNENKTRILPMPQVNKDDWVRELNSFRFPDEPKEIMFAVVRNFLDLALSLARREGKSSPLNYAIKMIPSRLNERAQRLFVQEAINLALVYPYLAPLLQEQVFKKHPNGCNQETISRFIDELLKVGLKKIYPDSIAHAIFYAMYHDLKFSASENRLKEILQIDDCVCNVLLLKYAQKMDLKKLKSAIKRGANDLKTEERRYQDRHWLLIYYVWSESDLRGNGQDFLADLKNQRFSFLKRALKRMLRNNTEQNMDAYSGFHVLTADFIPGDFLVRRVDNIASFNQA